MNMNTFFNWLCYSLISRRVAVTLVALACSNLAFCGEIHDAAESGDLEKVKTLLKNNPDLVSSKDEWGWTPLHRAASGGRMDVMKLLLAGKAEVNAKNKWGRMPLHMAADNGHKDVAELLLANRADVNTKDDDSWTALNYAAKKGHKDVAALLLANKAEVNTKDNSNWTPLDYAMAYHNKDVAELLRQHGGQAFFAKAVTTELNGAICKIDVTNKTFRVVPWDGKTKTWKRDSIIALSWEDGTQLVSGTDRLTMAKFIGGKPLDKDTKDVSDLRGDKGDFYIEKVGDKSVVRVVEIIFLFAGESMPAMVGSDSFKVVGSNKVHCDDE